jgi:hypothetical protein
MSTLLLAMATRKKTKTVKKVTEIPEASVKIEVEQKEEEKVTEKEEATELATEEKDIEKSEEEVDEVEEEKEPEIENFEDEGSRFGWSKVFLFVVIAAVTGFIIVGAYLFFIEGYNFSLTKEEAKKEINIDEKATPTPTVEEIDKTAYDITVLNGSGIAGEAASVQTLLKDEGFSVSEIGNAETADYTKSQILYAKGVDQKYLDELEKALKTRGPVEINKAESSQTEDVVVIVGSELSEEDATPTPELE